MGLDENSVVILDADDAVRTELERRVRQVGLDAQPFSNADAFLRELRQLDRPIYFAVISELHLPDTTGLHLLEYLNASQHIVSMVLFVASIRVRDAVRAMRAGAVAVVEKTDGAAGLMEFVEEALENARDEFNSAACLERAARQLGMLSAGEHQVLRGILGGRLNKEMAQDFKVSIRTIEQRRREVFKKLSVQHPASLACKILALAQTRKLVGVDAETIRWVDETSRQAGLPPAYRRRRLDGPHW